MVEEGVVGGYECFAKERINVDVGCIHNDQEEGEQVPHFLC